MQKIANLRQAYGEALVDIGLKDKNIVVLDSDLSLSTMSFYFKKKFPNRFFEMGICESNMLSVAAGLSLSGKIPFANSFSVFITGRAFDQIRQGIALPKLNVKIIGSSCGLSDYSDGATHQSIEDIAIMRSLPNMTVLVPADALEVKKIVREITNYYGPVYVRINRSDLPLITDESHI